MKFVDNPVKPNERIKDNNLKEKIKSDPWKEALLTHWNADPAYVADYAINQLITIEDTQPFTIVCSTGSIAGTYAGTNQYTYPNQPISSTVDSYIRFDWEVVDRPNRFTVYDSTGLLWTSGWVGQANYTGPWGASLNTAVLGSGYVCFQSTSGRYVKVETGPASPSTPISDAYDYTIVCLGSSCPSTKYTYATACGGGSIVGYLVGEFPANQSFTSNGNCYLTSYVVDTPTMGSVLTSPNFNDCCTPRPSANLNWTYYADSPTGQMIISVVGSPGNPYAANVYSTTAGSVYTGTYTVYEGDVVTVYTGTGGCGLPFSVTLDSAAASIDVLSGTDSISVSTCSPNDPDVELNTSPSDPYTVAAGDIGNNISITAVSECLTGC
jgi:hypothetical protein